MTFRPFLSVLRRALVLVAAGVLAMDAAAAGPRGQGMPVSVVFELFTSQGCSSCPPADALFHAMRKEPGILTLSLPVTIWDHLGWKDTLAKTTFSGRQKGYAYARGDRQIYTPQAVVNGVIHAVGSDRKALDDARQRSVMQTGVLAIAPVLKRKGELWSVHLPDSPLGRPAPPEAPQAGASERRHVHAGAVFVMIFEREQAVEIGRGENTGRTIRYGNIVRSIDKIGEYTGAAASFDLPAAARSDAAQGFAVIIQAGTDKHPGAIVGAVESPRD